MVRCGIYPRVSSLDEDQQKSYDNQIEEMTEYINSQPDWVLIDCYGDKGKSATVVKHRKGYKELINDINNKKLDLVILKNESRLDRNLLEGLLFLQAIIENDVKLFFLMEKKYYDYTSDLDVKVKMLVAENHSKELSKNINNATRRRQLKGRVLTNGKIWGYEQVNAQLVIKEDEAEIVRKVFEMYASGMGFRAIEQELEALIPPEVKQRRNITNIGQTTLKRMIRQEKYKGTVIGNKRHKIFAKGIKDNPNEEWIVIKDACPAIVSTELWEKANDELKKRQKNINLDDKKKLAGYWSGSYFLSGKMTCANCGSSYWHQPKYGKIGPVWQCGTYRQYGKKKCPAPSIPTADLRRILQNQIFQFIKDYGKTAIANVVKILEKTLVEPEKNNKEIQKLNENITKRSKEKKGLITLRAMEEITTEEFLQQKADIDRDIMLWENRIKELENQNIDVFNKIEKLNFIRENLTTQIDNPDNISDELIQEMVDSVVIHSKEKFEITVLGEKLLSDMQKRPMMSISGPEILPK